MSDGFRRTQYSERKLQFELDVTVIRFAGHHHECRAHRAGVYAAPIRMVDEIECFGTELDARDLIDGYPEILEQGQIPLPETRIPEDVSRVPGRESTLGRSRKGALAMDRCADVGQEGRRAPIGIAIENPELVAAARSDSRVVHVLPY